MPSYDAPSYWEGLLRSSFDLRAVGWPSLSYAFNAWQYRARRAAIDGVIRDARGLRVLDVGSGTGFWVAHWHARAAASVTGIDLTSTSISQLRQAFPTDSFVQADITEPIALSDSFDLISAMDVLLHITDDRDYRQSLMNLRAVTRPGTRLVALEPITFGPAPVHQESHVRIRSREAVERTWSEAGWSITAMRPAMWLLNYAFEDRPVLIRRGLHAYWRVIMRAARAELSGQVIGAAVYPFDRVLCRLPWGPATKVVLAEAS